MTSGSSCSVICGVSCAYWLITLRLLVALDIDIISDPLLRKHVVLGFVSVNKVFLEALREEY
jgi:hypothetical protein